MSRIKVLALMFLGLLLVVVLLQYMAGAFGNEFGQHPDEPAHYISGLLVRDYVAAFQFESPIYFAEDYYIHYPKVAIGHWPPVFYGMQGIWTLVFTPSHNSILVLIALLTAGIATCLYGAVRHEFGSTLALTIGLLFVALPTVQKYSGMIMSDILVALFGFISMLYFGQFLNRQWDRDSIGFGIFAALAILTSGNGLALALVPPIGLLLTRRFDLILRLSFWYPALIVLIACAPWYAVTLDMMRYGWQNQLPNLEFTLRALRFFLREFLSINGTGLSALALVGATAQVIGPSSKQEAKGQWVAAAALLLSVYIFHSLVPAALETRYLILAIPPFLMFVAAGINWLRHRLSLNHLGIETRAVMLSIVTVFIFAGETFEIPSRGWYGFGDVAQRLLSFSESGKSVFLVSADTRGEGAFIAEVAMREKRPGHVVLRATKVLARGSWAGTGYALLHHTPEEVMSYLDGIPVRYVVIDMSSPVDEQFQHQRLLLQTVQKYPHRWKSVGAFPLTRDGIEHPEVIQVFRLIGNENQQVKMIRVDMFETLKKPIERRFLNTK